jgi:C1A family cysteine protease
MNKLLSMAAMALLLGLGTNLFAQEAEEKEPVYKITETVNVKHTPVDNQGSSGTCWCFC